MMTDINIWRALNPGYAITENSPLISRSQIALPPEKKEEQVALLKEDGYCYIPSLIGSIEVAEMLACVQRLVEKNIPPVYCFVYDIFWQLILDLHPVLADILTKDYEIVPNAWAWHVDAQKKGYFTPHRDVENQDFIDSDGMPTLFSLWIPLTDVTTSQSCMYVLPGSRDPDYPEKALTWRKRWEKQGHEKWNMNDLVNIRALPAPKGTFMGWNGGVLHWGSKPALKAPPRISIGYLFVSPHAKKKKTRSVPLDRPFPLESRMQIIFDMLRIYGGSLSIS